MEVVWETRKEEAFLHLGLDELGSTLVTTIRVLVEDSQVVNCGVAAAVNHQGDERSKLCPGIARVVCVSRSLENVSDD